MLLGKIAREMPATQVLIFSDMLRKILCEQFQNPDRSIVAVQQMFTVSHGYVLARTQR